MCELLKQDSVEDESLSIKGSLKGLCNRPTLGISCEFLYLVCFFSAGTRTGRKMHVFLGFKSIPDAKSSQTMFGEKLSGSSYEIRPYMESVAQFLRMTALKQDLCIRCSKR